MDCKRYEAALREHSLGEPLSPALEAHLAACEACREPLGARQRLQTTIDTTLDHLRQIEPSPAFLARARKTALGSSPPHRLGRLERWAWSPILAVVVLALALGVIVARDRRLPEPTRPTQPSSPSASARPTLSEPAAPVSRAPTPLPSGPRPARPPEDRLAVLVPPGQEEAIVRLAGLVVTGVVAPPDSLVNPPDATQPLAPPDEVTVPPLAIEPLSPGASENEGVMP